MKIQCLYAESGRIIIIETKYNEDIVPNRWIVLDILAGKLSTRYYEQKSCMGLYNGYAELAKNVNSDVYVIEDRAHSMVCGIITIAR